MTLKAVIFDIDGTLLDSNDAHAEAFVRAFKDAGHPVSFEEVRDAIGMGGDLLVPAVGSIDPESDVGKRISARKKEVFFDEFFPKLKALPKARDLVVAIRDLGYRTAVATSADAQELEKFLQRIGVSDLMDVKTSKSDVSVSKPAPDVLQAALSKLGLSPEETLFIGDTPYDAEASSAAGVPFIGFRSGGRKAFPFENAIATYDGPADLLSRLMDSPLRPASQKPGIRVIPTASMDTTGSSSGSI